MFIIALEKKLPRPISLTKNISLTLVSAIQSCLDAISSVSMVVSGHGSSGDPEAKREFGEASDAEAEAAPATVSG